MINVIDKVFVDCKTVLIFAHSSTREQSIKRSGTRLKTESETRQRGLRASRAYYSYATLHRFFTDFEKKTDCFAV